MISIIIPVYNAEKYIGETLNSILKQTYKDYEIIIINDGSSDNTAEICKKYEKKCQCITYYEKENSGVSDTRNFGLSHSMGDYIVFVDADDMLPIDSLQIYMDEMKNGDYDVVFGNSYYDYDGKMIPRVARIDEGIYNYEELKDIILDDGTLTGFLFGSVWAACYKKSIIDANNIIFDKNVRVNEDGLFNLKYVYNSKKIRVLDSSFVYIYRQWKSNNVNNLVKNEKFDEAERAIHTFLNEIEGLEVYKTQLACRNVSVAFWNALRIENSLLSYKDTKDYLLQLFNDKKVKDGLTMLNYKRMNIYKKIICNMIKHNRVWTFYVAIKYAYPILAKVCKR